MTATQPEITLPRDAYHHLIYTLRELMPPISGTPEDLVRRDNAAIAQVAALCPTNAAQAALAAQYVAANAHAMQCLRETRAPDATAEDSRRNTAQAASMMRQSQGALRLLLRAQGFHAGRKPDDAAKEAAAWTEHCAEQWMLRALHDGAEESEIPIDRPTGQRLETKSDTRDHDIDQAPALAGRDESQTPLHSPATHTHETNSRDPDPGPQPESINPGHNPDHRDHETKPTTFPSHHLPWHDAGPPRVAPCCTSPSSPSASETSTICVTCKPNGR